MKFLPALEAEKWNWNKYLWKRKNQEVERSLWSSQHRMPTLEKAVLKFMQFDEMDTTSRYATEVREEHRTSHYINMDLSLKCILYQIFKLRNGNQLRINNNDTSSWSCRLEVAKNPRTLLPESLVDCGIATVRPYHAQKVFNGEDETKKVQIGRVYWVCNTSVVRSWAGGLTSEIHNPIMIQQNKHTVRFCCGFCLYQVISCCVI